MLRKSVFVALCVLLAGPALSAFAGLDPDLVTWWPFDEGQGTVAADGSGNGNDGTLVNGPVWVTGQLDGALQFNGTNAYVRGGHVPLDSRSFTVAMWINPVLSGSAIFFSQTESSSQNLNMHFRLGGPSSTDAPVRGVRMGFYSNDLSTSGGLIQDNTWYHLTFWYDFEGRNRKIYIDGVEVAQAAADPYLGSTGDTIIGSWNAGSQWYNGIVDDVQIYHRALSDAEIQKIMSGLADTSLARDSVPANGAIDVPRDAILSWVAGESAATHDVYFGTTFADVNDAGRANPMDVLVLQDGTAVEYDPENLLEYGQTYYWRVDEVNAAPDNTIFKGEVWSFTAEPFGYPIENVIATASSSQSGMGPEKTVDGSGLDENDQHGNEPTTMWLSTGVQPNWIQFELDKVYKLSEMSVWNSNQLIEPYLGFGAKEVVIEYSADGANWATLDGVPEFAQATGATAYESGTTVDFGGVLAKYVKLTIADNWGMAPQAGLSEVRFSSIPVQAREPQPAADATEVSVDTALDWRPGREAVSHDLYFGVDADAVAGGTVPTETLAEHGYVPGSLDFGTTYHWRVDEVGEAVSYPGELWSFTTQEYAVVDDFESYTDDEGSRIYETWIDGWTNGSGSVVGYLQAPFAERTIVHDGAQSMPIEYNNVNSPYYSEAECTWSTAQDWTGNGATHLNLWIYGYPVSFLEAPTGEITMSAAGADIYNQTDQFRYAYKRLTGDGSITVRVDSADNVHTWTKAGVMIRESLEPVVKSAHMIVTPSGRVEFQYRSITGGSTTQPSLPVDSITLPCWVRLTRSGDTFTGEYSADGNTWQDLVVDAGTSSTSLLMFSDAYIGLAVTSHSANVLTVAQFSNVETTGGVSGPWQVADIGVDHGGNGPGDLYVTVEDSAGKAATVTYPNGANVNGWTPWEIPLSEFISAGVNVTAVKEMSISVGDPANPTPSGAGMIFVDDIGYGKPAGQ